MIFNTNNNNRRARWPVLPTLLVLLALGHLFFTLFLSATPTTSTTSFNSEMNGADDQHQEAVQQRARGTGADRSSAAGSVVLARRGAAEDGIDEHDEDDAVRVWPSPVYAPPPQRNEEAAKEEEDDEEEDDLDFTDTWYSQWSLRSSPNTTETFKPPPGNETASPTVTSNTPSPSVAGSSSPTSSPKSPTPSISTSPSSSPSPSASPSASGSPSATPSISGTPSGTPSMSPSASTSPSSSPSASPSPSTSGSPSATPSPSPSTTPLARTELEVYPQTGRGEVRLYAPGATSTTTRLVNEFGDVIALAANGSVLSRLPFPQDFVSEEMTVKDRIITHLAAPLNNASGLASRLQLDYFFFTEAVPLSFAGVDFTAQRGQAKYSVNILDGWPFSTVTPEQATGGMELSVLITIDAAITDVATLRNAPGPDIDTYVFYAGSLGVRYELVVVALAVVDANEAAPARINVNVEHAVVSTRTGSITEVTLRLRFPAFTTSLVYDPSLGVLFGNSPSDGSGGGSSIDAGLIGGLVGGLIGGAVLIVLLVGVATLVVMYIKKQQAVNQHTSINFDALDGEL